MPALPWFVLAAVSAIGCWFASQRGMVTTFRVAKPLVLVGLLGCAVALGAALSLGGTLLLGGLALALVGDLLFVLKHAWAFNAGMGAFLAAHAAYLAAFTVWHAWSLATGVLAVVAALLAGGLAVTAGRRIHRGARRRESVRAGWAVAMYILVSVLTAVTAAGTGSVILLVGVLLWLVSDTVLGLDRFVAPRPQAGLFVIVSYHLAQALVVVGGLA